MINDFYDILNTLGYHHPFHPTEVHMPIGLVVGALILALVALIFRRDRLLLTPRYLIILAFLWVFPTMLLGIMDWQHFYGGAFILPFKVKLITAPILTVLLGLAVFLGRRYGSTSMKVLPVYFLCFCAVVVLGYFGGQLTYSGRTISGPKEYMAGQKLFSAYCTTCHPGGGNTLAPNKPILHSPLLKNQEFFNMWIRHPASPMPAFPPHKISDAQLKDMYDYISHVIMKR
jgi:uncharacterized membrane protein